METKFKQVLIFAVIISIGLVSFAVLKDRKAKFA